MLSIPTLNEYIETPNFKGLRNWTIKLCRYNKDLADELIADYLVIPWVKIVQEYDKNLTPDFFKYVFITYRFNVYRAYEARRRKLSKGTDIDGVTCTATDLNAANDDTTWEGASNVEDEAFNELQRKEVHEALSKLPATESFVLWNYALGFSFEDIGKQLGYSRVTVGVIHRGALEQLKRITGLANDN